MTIANSDTHPLTFWVNVYQMRGWKWGADGTLRVEGTYATEDDAVADIGETNEQNGIRAELGIAEYLCTIAVRRFANGNWIAPIVNLEGEADEWREKQRQAHEEDMRHMSAEKGPL